MEASDRPVRVLVVEDDQEIAQVLQRALRLEGYEVRLAGDGVAALDEVHAFLPDLIVLDLGLPRMDGIDVARRLRQGTADEQPAGPTSYEIGGRDDPDWDESDPDA